MYRYTYIGNYPCSRAIGRYENPGVPVLFGGHNRPALVEMGLTDLPKCGGAMAPPAGTTGLIDYLPHAVLSNLRNTTSFFDPTEVTRNFTLHSAVFF